MSLVAALAGHPLFWKIDQYNKDMTAGSEDPSDLVTDRLVPFYEAERGEITRGHSNLPRAGCTQLGHRLADTPPASLVPEISERSHLQT